MKKSDRLVVILILKYNQFIKIVLLPTKSFQKFFNKINANERFIRYIMKLRRGPEFSNTCYVVSNYGSRGGWP